jgi:hypothetical protein
MAFEACIPSQFKQDILNGVHKPSDVYRVALFLQSKATDKNSSSTVYTSIGELAHGYGYTQGGIILSGFKTRAAGKRACLDFHEALWPEATITADAAVIYNHSRRDKVLVILGFPRTESENGPFSLQLGGIFID